MSNVSATPYIRLYDIEPGRYDCFTVEEYESTYRDILAKLFVDRLSRGDYFLLRLLISHCSRYLQVCSILGRTPIKLDDSLISNTYY